MGYRAAEDNTLRWRSQEVEAFEEETFVRLEWGKGEGERKESCVREADVGCGIGSESYLGVEEEGVETDVAEDVAQEVGVA